jgi:hypothetical protein
MCTCAAALALTSLLGGIDIGRSIPPNGFSRVAAECATPPGIRDPDVYIDAEMAV